MKFNTIKGLTTLTNLVSLSSVDCELSNDGNYYCSSTNCTVSSNVGLSSSYKNIIFMVELTCAFTFVP